jgi:hypothetical protein
LSALAADGAYRHGLDGVAIGPVDAEHRAEATKLLEARKKG